MTEDGESIKGLIEYLAQALVDDPDSVEVVTIQGDQSTTYEIRVGPNDLGKVIGKQGRIANALRSVAKAAAMKSKRKVFVEIAA